MNENIIYILEKKIGSVTTHVGPGEFAFFCPVCVRKGLGQSRKPSLYINPDKGKFHCWRCEFKGNSFRYLGKALGIPELYSKSLFDYAETIQEFLNPSEPEIDTKSVGEGNLWPSDYREVPVGTQAMLYLHGRGVSPETAMKYSVGVGTDQNGGRLIFPCFYHTKMVYWTTRAYVEGIPCLDALPKKSAPDVERKGAIFGFDVFYGKPQIRVCEGPISAMVADGVSMISATYTSEQLNTLLEMGAMEYSILFDADPPGIEGGLKLARELTGKGKNVSFVMLPDGKDPADVGSDQVDWFVKNAALPFNDKTDLQIQLLAGGPHGTKKKSGVDKFRRRYIKHPTRSEHRKESGA